MKVNKLDKGIYKVHILNTDLPSIFPNDQVKWVFDVVASQDKMSTIASEALNYIYESDYLYKDFGIDEDKEFTHFLTFINASVRGTYMDIIFVYVSDDSSIDEKYFRILKTKPLIGLDLTPEEKENLRTRTNPHKDLDLDDLMDMILDSSIPKKMLDIPNEMNSAGKTSKTSRNRGTKENNLTPHQKRALDEKNRVYPSKNHDLRYLVVGLGRDFEQVIGFAQKTMYSYLDDITSNLYSYEDQFYYTLDLDDEGLEVKEKLETLATEFGAVSYRTEAVLAEYGKCLIEESALYTILQNFCKEERTAMYSPKWASQEEVHGGFDSLETTK